MSKKKKICPYEQVTGKIDTIDTKLEKARCEIESLVKRLEEDPEICPDVEDSEKALQDTLVCWRCLAFQPSASPCLRGHQ